MGVSLADSSVTSATPGVLVAGTVDPTQDSFGVVNLVVGTQSDRAIADQIDSSYIVNGDTAYWGQFTLRHDGQMWLRIASALNDIGDFAGPQLTEAAEDAIYIVLFYGSASAAWEFAELDASDEDEPYVFSAASVTAAGPTNDGTLRTAINADSSVIAMLVDGSHANIDIANLEIADPPEQPTAPDVRAKNIRIDALPADPTSDSPIIRWDARYRLTSETAWKIQVGVQVGSLLPAAVGMWEVQMRAVSAAQNGIGAWGDSAQVNVA